MPCRTAFVIEPACLLLQVKLRAHWPKSSSQRNSHPSGDSLLSCNIIITFYHTLPHLTLWNGIKSPTFPIDLFLLGFIVRFISSGHNSFSGYYIYTPSQIKLLVILFQTKTLLSSVTLIIRFLLQHQIKLDHLSVILCAIIHKYVLSFLFPVFTLKVLARILLRSLPLDSF